jgi:hypothetical protein
MALTRSTPRRAYRCSSPPGTVGHPVAVCEQIDGQSRAGGQHRQGHRHDARRRSGVDRHQRVGAAKSMKPWKFEHSVHETETKLIFVCHGILLFSTWDLLLQFQKHFKYQHHICL